MYIEKLNSVYSSEIAEYIGKEILGNDIVIYAPNDLNCIQNNGMLYLSVDNFEKVITEINANFNELLILTEFQIPKNKYEKFTFIISENAFQDYIKVIKYFFAEKIEIYKIDESAYIDSTAKIGEKLFIGRNVFIGSNVTIGDNTKIFYNSVLSGKISIGNNCVIKSNSTIGSEGFTYTYNNKGMDDIPQLGGIIIKDNVSIGANSSIENGIIGNTILKENVKIDDLVQIGSNSIIEINSIIAAGSIICRNVHIMKNCWIAPNCCIKENITIGANTIIGFGSVVINDVQSNSIIAGVPAKILNNKVKKLCKK